MGGFDIVVSNAMRRQTIVSVKNFSFEHLDWTIKTNIYALFWIIKAALP